MTTVNFTIAQLLPFFSQTISRFPWNMFSIDIAELYILYYINELYYWIISPYIYIHTLILHSSHDLPPPTFFRSQGWFQVIGQTMSLRCSKVLVSWHPNIVTKTRGWGRFGARGWCILLLNEEVQNTRNPQNHPGRHPYLLGVVLLHLIRVS